MYNLNPCKFLHPFLFIYILLVFKSSVFAQTVVSASGYALSSQINCDGFPQVDLKTQAQNCVGLVADKSNKLKMPRYAVQDAAGTIYISDMGAWDFQRGTIWAMHFIPDLNHEKNYKIELVDLFPNKNLTMPTGLLIDPEGRLYVGMPTGVYRFFPKESLSQKLIINPSLELVENSFLQSIFRKEEYANLKSFRNMSPDYKHKHPLVQLAANKEFTEIYLNLGAPSDSCNLGIKTKDKNGFCIQAESELVSAGVWKLQLTADSRREKISTRPIARGLRNSMALAVHSESQLLFQGENSLDLKDEDLPFEEINLIEDGAHYGWPYCHSANQVSSEFKNIVNPNDCSQKYKAPLLFMPAHVAPMGLLFYSGKLMENLKSTLLVSWHGYRQAGHKVVAYTVDTRGIPINNQPKNVIFGWDAENQVRPRGAPTGLLELNDGSILIMDDKNSAILRLSKGEAWTEKNSGATKTEKVFSANQKQKFEKILPWLKQNCSACHLETNTTNSDQALAELVKRGYFQLEKPEESLIYLKIKERKMPPTPLPKEKYKAIDALLEEFIQSLKH